jgi:signal transduction histidine kinase/ActR/RegA family two-component response regulator
MPKARRPAKQPSSTAATRPPAGATVANRRVGRPTRRSAALPGDDAQRTAAERTTAVLNREGAVDAREHTAARREGAAALREDAADLRDETARLREEAARLREEAAGLREETSTLREDAVRAREQASGAKAELVRLLAQLQEANANLVVGTIRAQTAVEDAEDANHLKDEFLATVSHELRTPLNAILGWARMLDAKQLPSERAEKGIAIIKRNASALSHIIEDLLDVSRIAAGTLRMASAPVDLIVVAESALEVVRPLALAKKVDLVFTADRSDLKAVRADASRLEQVIWNLLANAIKFTPEGGRVELLIARADDQIEIRVVDTGQGISADFLPRVFDRFRQAEAATTRRFSGLGLGLALVRQIVELHGGTVEAASAGVGLGATFTVRLPVAVEARTGQAGTLGLGDRRTAASNASPMPRLPRLDGLRVLVVDDDEDGRTLTTLVLTQAGAAVIGAGSVAEALAALDAEQPDVLVSDIGLPDDDGFALIHQIRRDEVEHGGFLPAVALTGYARAEDRDRIIAAGFQAHVPKPVDPSELTAAIARIVGHGSGDS